MSIWEGCMIKGTKSEESNLEINLSGIETDDKMFGGKGQNQKKKKDMTLIGD